MLTKSRISAFEQCPRRLWLQVHAPVGGAIDAATQLRFANGRAAGAAACSLHPGGMQVEAVPDLGAALATTTRLLAEQHPGPIFEATFAHDGVLVRADVLRRDGQNGWFVEEVKSSAKLKDHYLGDLATQVWVMESCGVVLNGAAIAHVDNRFVLTREGDYCGLFASIDMLSEARDIARHRPGLVQDARKVLAGKEPVREPGDHCSTPFACEFVSHCTRHLPDGPQWPVTVLPHGGGKRWLAQGVDDLLALDEMDLKPLHARVLAATRSGEAFHDAEGARMAIGKWPRPHAFLDFETIAPAVPLWVGTRPYQQIPFQFSAHVERDDGTLTHHEFLQIDGIDPRRACAEALVKALPQTGAIIAYNASFERGVLRDLAKAVPQDAAALLDMAERTVDLLPVAKTCWYHRDQRGSWSIKAVLPTMSAIGYEGMEVKDGGEAQSAFVEAIAPECSSERRWALAEGLKAYCERDTWAMVVVMRRLVGADNLQTNPLGGQSSALG